MKNIFKLTMLFAIILLIASSLSAYGKMKDLKYPPLGTVTVPEPEKIILDNGIQVYILEDHELPSFSIFIKMNKCGSYLEPPAKIGLASMTGEVMRTGGTKSMTGDEIDEELEAIGAYVETGIGNVSGSASAGGLSEYAEKIISIFADVVRNPVFDEDKIELAITSAKSNISRRNDDGMTILLREYRKIIFGEESPYSRNTEYATIDAIEKEDLIRFHGLTVQPNNMQMALYGDVNRDEALALINKYFGDWPAATMELPVPPDVEYTFKPSVNFAEKSDITQSNVILGHIGGKMKDPDYPATIVMNSILGGSFGSRITDNVRTKHGYAYTAQANYSFNYDYPGWFYAYAGTKGGSTVAAIKIMMEQIRSMQTIPPTEEEMRKAKDGWLNSFVFNFDTKGEVLNRMMTYDYYDMPVDFLQQLKEAVEQVTPEDIIEVAQRKLNPNNLQILVVGKADEFDEPLSVLGEVNEIDITIPEPEVIEFVATDEELNLGMEKLAAVVEACGGTANFQKIKSLETSSKVNINMSQGAMMVNVTNIQILPDKSAQIVSMPMGSQKQIYVGTEGWTIAAGQTTPMSEADLNEQKQDLSRNTHHIFANFDNPDYQIAFRGAEEFEGQPAVKYEILTSAGAQFSLYVDPQTNLPIGNSHFGNTYAGPGEIVNVIHEHGSFGGVMMPVKMTQKSGPMTMDIEITNTVINGKIDESIFVKPDGI
ncbi:MAG: pitrilysin family protein [Candidatus Zixiibacteriota bacterium]